MCRIFRTAPAMDEPLSETTITEMLNQRPFWKLKNGKLYRHFQTKNFHQGMMFLTRVGEFADEHHHHPDIHLTNYKYIEIELSTPRVQGITLMDFQMVDLIDTIPVDYSLLWKHAHPNIETERNSVTTRVPISSSSSATGAIPRKYDTIFPRHRLHGQESQVKPPPPPMSSEDTMTTTSTVHTQPISYAPGSVQHSEPWSVSTAEHTPLGQSDIQHHAEVRPSLTISLSHTPIHPLLGICSSSPSFLLW
jgi:4a-hydroxytetrahydrobiopterin dehydratase